MPAMVLERRAYHDTQTKNDGKTTLVQVGYGLRAAAFGG
jgi:hypothetical protein